MVMNQSPALAWTEKEIQEIKSNKINALMDRVLYYQDGLLENSAEYIQTQVIVNALINEAEKENQSKHLPQLSELQLKQLEPLMNESSKALTSVLNEADHDENAETKEQDYHFIQQALKTLSDSSKESVIVKEPNVAPQIPQNIAQQIDNCSQQLKNSLTPTNSTQCNQPPAAVSHTSPQGNPVVTPQEALNSGDKQNELNLENIVFNQKEAIQKRLNALASLNKTKSSGQLLWIFHKSGLSHQIETLSFAQFQGLKQTLGEANSNIIQSILDSYHTILPEKYWLEEGLRNTAIAFNEQSLHVTNGQSMEAYATQLHYPYPYEDLLRHGNRRGYYDPQPINLKDNDTIPVDDIASRIAIAFAKGKANIYTAVLGKPGHFVTLVVSHDGKIGKIQVLDSYGNGSGYLRNLESLRTTLNQYGIQGTENTDTIQFQNPTSKSLHQQPDGLDCLIFSTLNAYEIAKEAHINGYETVNAALSDPQFKETQHILKMSNKYQNRKKPVANYPDRTNPTYRPFMKAFRKDTLELLRKYQNPHSH